MFSIIGTVGLLLMAASLVGYLIGVGALQSVAFVTPVALHTALGLAILFLGALALRPDGLDGPTLQRCQAPLRPACCCR